MWMQRARRLDCLMNIISFRKASMTTLLNTKSSCSPITIAGKKLTTHGATRTLTKRRCSITDWNEKLPPISQAMPLLMSGSADLYGSTMNYIKDGGDFTRDTPGGRNIRFGVREHGMCAILNGISYHGLFRASGATFLVFT